MPTVRFGSAELLTTPLTMLLTMVLVPLEARAVTIPAAEYPDALFDTTPITRLRDTVAFTTSSPVNTSEVTAVLPSEMPTTSVAAVLLRLPIRFCVTWIPSSNRATIPARVSWFGAPAFSAFPVSTVPVFFPAPALPPV